MTRKNTAAHDTSTLTADGAAHTDDGRVNTPGTAEHGMTPHGVVSPDGLPKRDTGPVAQEAAERQHSERAHGAEDGGTPHGDPTPHLHPGPASAPRENGAARQAMMSDAGQTPAGVGRFALVVVAVAALVLVLWLL